jgi:hypothetical protein
MCDDRHDLVVYTEYDNRNKHHKCPVCEALSRVAELEEALHDCESNNADLEEENKSLVKECENFQQILDADGGDR